MSAISHHNTTREHAPLLENLEAKAKLQEKVIVDLFVKYKRLTPSEVYQLVRQQYPLTSVRRAITNLTGAGELIKTDEKKVGIYGRSEYVWIKAGI
jgi:hypothetical protein